MNTIATKLSKNQKRRIRRKYHNKLAAAIKNQAAAIDQDIIESFYFGDAAPLARSVHSFSTPFSADSSLDRCDDFLSDLELDATEMNLVKELADASILNYVDLDHTVGAIEDEINVPIWSQTDDQQQRNYDIYTNDQAAYDYYNNFGNSNYYNPQMQPPPLHSRGNSITSSPSSYGQLSPRSWGSASPRSNAAYSPRSNSHYSPRSFAHCAPPLYEEPTPEPKGPNFNAMSIRELLKMQMSVEELAESKLVERFAYDKEGCRYIQDEIMNSNGKTGQHLISLLIEYFVQEKMDLVKLSEDIYGNYFVQLICERGSVVHHEILLNYFVYEAFVRLSRSQCGCRVVQKLIYAIKDKKQLTKLVDAMRVQTQHQAQHQSLRHLMVNCNAAHVLQALIESELPFEAVEFIALEFNKNLAYFSEDTYACRVIQSIVKQYGDKLDFSQLFLNNNHLVLSRTKYGNYVIQCIVAKDQWYSSMPAFCAFRKQLFSEIFNGDNILSLSKSRHGSHMLETCLRSANKHEIDMFVNAICAKRAFVLKEMMKNQFANYVPKTLMSRCNTKQKQAIATSVHAYISDLYKINERRFAFCQQFVYQCQAIKFNLDGNHYCGYY